MTRKPKQTHYLRAWREAAGLSLRQLADRLTDDAGEPLVSYASLSRIEAGRQPYSQPILEALAEALHCTPADLLARHPLVPRREQRLLALWDQMDERQKAQVLAVVEALARLRG